MELSVINLMILRNARAFFCKQTKKLSLLSAVDLHTLLLNDINKNLNFVIKEYEGSLEWTKDLSQLPVFTIREI